jgi:sugar lactone lactonase YvrE
VDVLADGHGLVESPRWHDGRLWFADWLAGEIIAVDDRGTSEVVARHRSLPLCFDFLPDGRLLLVSSPEHALLELRPDGSTSSYADLAHLSQYGCNDIVIDGRGNAYVNNGNFDFATGPPAGEHAPGFVALVRADGSAAVVADDLAFPNGMAVTPDNRTLVVAESYRNRLTGFAINADGSLGERRVWADLVDGVPDGICIDADGAAWYADVPNQRCVRVREGGEVLDTVQLDRGGFACMLGGEPTAPRLYIVAAHWPGGKRFMDPTHVWDGQALSVPAPAPAAGWPGH